MSNQSKSSAVSLLVSTKKGSFILRSDAGRKEWNIQGPLFLGHIIHHFVENPIDRTLLIAAKTGHLGPTIYRSTDGGESWQEASKPPAFATVAEGEKGLVVDHAFWLTPGHPSEPGVWYAGTSPQGLFRSSDSGDTWTSVTGFNDNENRAAWCSDGGTPDGPKMHSILIDPRDREHMYIGMSSGGVFETTDQGQSWAPLNAGCRVDFLPDPYPEFGHDPHCVRLHPLEPDILYQQNHCGIYRMERSEANWIRIGDNMPKEVGDIGFPMVLHARDSKTVWVFPMDGTQVWPRTSPDGKPAVYVTRDSGQTWQRLDHGLPSQAWFTVLRQAMTADACETVGIYFGTTSGEIWASSNEGEDWRCIARHLPHIYAVEAVNFTL